MWLRRFAACLRKELRLHIADPGHFIGLIAFPLVLVILLTNPLRLADGAAARTTDSVAFAGDRSSGQALEDRGIEVDRVAAGVLRDEVREGRRFFGLVESDAELRIVADPSFPTAATAFRDRLRASGIEVPAAAEDTRGRPIDLDRPASAYSYTVPGFTVMFLFSLAAFTGLTLYGDVVHGVWVRIGASGVNRATILASKIVGSVIVGLLQLFLMFLLGRVALDVSFGLSAVPGLVAIGIAVSLTAATLGVVVTGLTRTAQQMYQANGVLLVLLGVFGGALVPVAALDGLPQKLSVFTPQYWAMRGFLDLTTRDLGLGSVPGDILPLLAMAAVFFILGLVRLRYSRLSRAIY